MDRPFTVKANASSTYVFPDGTEMRWVESLGQVSVKPAKGHGISLAAGEFGGVVFLHSKSKE